MWVLPAELVERHPPNGAKRLEDEPTCRSNFTIGSGEGHVGMMLGDEFEGPAGPQVDLADGQRLARRIPPAGDMLPHCPGVKNLGARRIEITRQFDSVRLAINDQASFPAWLLLKTAFHFSFCCFIVARWASRLFNRLSHC